MQGPHQECQHELDVDELDRPRDLFAHVPRCRMCGAELTEVVDAVRAHQTQAAAPAPPAKAYGWRGDTARAMANLSPRERRRARLRARGYPDQYA